MKDKQPGRNRKTLETRGYSPKLNQKLNIEDIIRLKETEEKKNNEGYAAWEKRENTRNSPQ